jgi:hypothetical protein
VKIVEKGSGYGLNWKIMGKKSEKINSENSEKMSLAIVWIEKKWKKIVEKKSEKMGLAMGWIEKKVKKK